MYVSTSAQTRSSWKPLVKKILFISKSFLPLLLQLLRPHSAGGSGFYISEIGMAKEAPW